MILLCSFQLLEKDATKRLGVKNGINGDVSDQPFFKGVNFDKLERKQMTPPFKPNLVRPKRKQISFGFFYTKLLFCPFQLNAKDVSYFDSAFTEDDPLLTPLAADFVSAMNQDQFKGFSYTDPNYTLPDL